MVNPAVFWATLGGILWGFGPLGKRFGVACATDSEKAALSACTVVVYSIGVLICPAVGFLLVAPDERNATFSDTVWRSRTNLIMWSGFSNGLGTVFGTVSLSLADHNLSGWIAMVQNGVYAVMTAMLLIFIFGEHPTVLQWLSAIIVILGIFTMDLSRLVAAEGAEDDKRLAAQEHESLPYGAIDELLADKGGGEGHEPLQFPCQRRCRGGCEAPRSEWGISARQASFYLALAAGMTWSLGPPGKKYGVDGAPVAQQTSRSACTYLVYSLGSLIPSLLTAFHSCVASAPLPAGVGTAWFRQRAPAVFICGVLNASGGIVCTYAFAVARPGTSTVIAMVENGIYTLAGSLLIVLAYREKPGKWQVLSASLILLAVILADTA